MLIKKDKNAELEKILAQKKVNEQAKNLLQGILYKIEVSNKDYQKVKAKKQTEEKYVEQLIKNIDKKCSKISVVKLSQKLVDEEIQKQLEKKKYYVGEEIVSYPIEGQILYAVEKKSRYEKILNNKYEDVTIAVSDMINEGKNMDRTEVLRDFNGWSWNTLSKEIENIEANLIYQILQIMLGEEFLDNWCEDKDGIIDYLEQFMEETTQKFGEKLANNQKELLIKIAIANTAKVKIQFAEKITQQIQQINHEIQKYDDTKQKIIEISNHKKQLLQELNKIEMITGQEHKLKEEFEKRNEDAPINKKIFSIKVFKNKLYSQKQELLEQIEKNTYLLNPSNYVEEKNKLIAKKEQLQYAEVSQEQLEEMLIEFVENFLKCFRILIKKANDKETLIRLIYQYRYFMQIPFNLEKNIKDVEKLQKNIIGIEDKLVEKAIVNKVILDLPIEIMRHLFRSRIIILEDLYYIITKETDKYYVQIFDENISEEKFEMEFKEKTKINKKIKIFI